MSRSRGNYHGLLVVDKPGLDRPPALGESSIETTPSIAERLYTSHDIVQLVRRWSKQRRIGHTGTLDPMASGVLILCMGLATRLVEYYQGHDKQYYAEVKLGVATDTYDAMGKVTATAVVPGLTVAEIDAVLARFRGDIMQHPPIFSALKQGGESLHRKARRGESVEIAPRPITIHALHLVDWIEPDRLCIRVSCSAGSYIRSLAHDIGQALGSGAHLAHLRRESAGPFGLDLALDLAEIESAAAMDSLETLLLPTGHGLDLPQVLFDPEEMARLGHGQTIVVAGEPWNHADDDWRGDQIAQGRDRQGRFLGIVRCLGRAEPPTEGWLWKAQKWLAGAEPGPSSHQPDIQA